MWKLQLRTLPGLGVNLGDVPFEQLTLERRISDTTRISGSCDALDSSVVALEPAAAVARLTDDGTLRFQGKVEEPLTDTADLVSFHASDPWAWLRRRRIRENADYTAGLDAGAIAWDLIADAHALGTTRLRQGAIATSVTRAVTYPARKIVAEAVEELAKADDGFWFTILPVDGVSGILGEFVVRYPSSGVDQPGVRFEFGVGSLTNLKSFTRTRTLPTNRVVAVGSAGAHGVAEDATSITANDMIEKDVAQSDVVDQALLNALATGALQPGAVDRYSFEIAAGGGLGSVQVPRLFRDFDVGDVCRLTLVGGRVGVTNVPVRVLAATIVIGKASNHERLSKLEVELV